MDCGKRRGGSRIMNSTETKLIQAYRLTQIYYTIKDVKRSPVTKKLLIHIDDSHCMDLSLLKPDKV